VETQLGLNYAAVSEFTVTGVADYEGRPTLVSHASLGAESAVAECAIAECAVTVVSDFDSRLTLLICTTAALELAAADAESRP
jgi:hypothetical protein